MELGGSDPFMVMESADLKAAVETAVNARTISNGQSCIAAKRFIIDQKIYPAFKEAFVAQMRALKMGDPMDSATQLGPLVSLQARKDLHALVLDAKNKGASVLTGGSIPEGEGAFYPATVLEGIPADALLAQEEAFGPVATLYSARDLDHAIEIANSTRFGLGSSFWSTNAAQIEEATHRIRAGSVFVNAMMASDPRLPFGGVGVSGFGRELGAVGAKEFTNTKTILIHENH